MGLDGHAYNTKGTFFILKRSFKDYPIHSVVVIFAIVVSGLAESLSILTMLPLLQLGLGRVETSGSFEKESSSLTETFNSFFSFVGVEPNLIILLSLIVVMFAVKSFATLVSQAYVGIVAARVSSDLRLRLIKALLSTSWSFLTTKTTGRFSNSFSSEAQRASNTYLSAWNMVSSVIQTGMFVLASALVSTEILFYGFGAGIFIMCSLHWTVLLSRRAGNSETVLMNDLISRLNDTLSGIKPIMVMGLSRPIFNILNRDTESLRQAQNKQAFAIAAQGNLPEPIMILILALGVFYALEFTDITLAHLFVVALFFNRMVGRITKFQKFYQMINVSQSAYHSIQRVIADTEKETSPIGGALDIRSLEKNILLKNVSFAYEGTSVLSNVTLNIPAKKLTTVIGPSGSGKTTIADLISGLLSPSAGEILIDDVRLSDADVFQWRRRIGYVPQELFLFHDTIRNNITLGDDEISEDEIWHVLELCGALEFVGNLNHKLDTIIGEHGSKLSGGQRQRIMIARALIRDPELIILDEATTSLDPVTEKAICATIHEISRDVTILAISHQSAMKDLADNVIELPQRI